MPRVHRVRCRNSACRHRRNSKTHPDNYLSSETTPVCSRCGQRKGWRIENRLYKVNTCRCDGVPYPHEYMSHVNCLDRKKQEIAKRFYEAPEPANFFLSLIMSSFHPIHLYLIRNMAYVTAHTSREAIQVLSDAYPCTDILKITESDVLQLEADYPLEGIQLYDLFDTSGDKAPLYSLNDAWLQNEDCRVMAINSGLTSLLCFAENEYQYIDDLSVSIVKNNHPNLFI